jgi:hypothetical protein
MAEHRIENDVAAARWALEHRTSDTAAQVARTTEAHAKGLALVAREAAAARADFLEAIRQQTEVRARSARTRIDAAVR